VEAVIRPIEAEVLAQVLRRLNGRRVYLHVEITPGGFMRNLATDIAEVVLRCDGPTCRIALRCGGHGWVIMEGLTHMCVRDGEPLLIYTLEGDRLTRVIQISEEAFAA
jgi:hypothetical protein